MNPDNDACRAPLESRAHDNATKVSKRSMTSSNTQVLSSFPLDTPSTASTSQPSSLALSSLTSPVDIIIQHGFLGTDETIYHYNVCASSGSENKNPQIFYQFSVNTTEKYADIMLNTSPTRTEKGVAFGRIGLKTSCHVDEFGTASYYIDEIKVYFPFETSPPSMSSKIGLHDIRLSRGGRFSLEMRPNDRWPLQSYEIKNSKGAEVQALNGSPLTKEFLKRFGKGEKIVRAINNKVVAVTLTDPVVGVKRIRFLGDPRDRSPRFDMAVVMIVVGKMDFTRRYP